MSEGHLMILVEKLKDSNPNWQIKDYKKINQFSFLIIDWLKPSRRIHMPYHTQLHTSKTETFLFSYWCKTNKTSCFFCYFSRFWLRFCLYVLWKLITQEVIFLWSKTRAGGTSKMHGGQSRLACMRFKPCTRWPESPWRSCNVTKDKREREIEIDIII